MDDEDVAALDDDDFADLDLPEPEAVAQWNEQNRPSLTSGSATACDSSPSEEDLHHRVAEILDLVSRDKCGNVGKHDAYLLLCRQDDERVNRVIEHRDSLEVRAGQPCVYFFTQKAANAKRKRPDDSSWIQFKPGSAQSGSCEPIYVPGRSLAVLRVSLTFKDKEQQQQHGKMSIGSYCVVLLEGDPEWGTPFPDGTPRKTGIASRQKTEFQHLNHPPRLLVCAMPEEAPPGKLLKLEADQLLIKGVDVFDELMSMKEELLRLQRDFEAANRAHAAAATPSFTSHRADLAEWMRRLDPDEVILAGDVVQVRGERMTRKISSEPGGTLFVVSSAPGIELNVQEEPTSSEGAMLAFIGRVPVYCIGEAAVDMYLVPSGKDDGSAKAVAWAELQHDEALRASCFGVVWALLPPDEFGRSMVLAFVSAHPTQAFGSFRGVEDIAPLSCTAPRRKDPPPPLQPRPYQSLCIERAKEENTLVCLPTGLGKTLVATEVIKHFIALKPNKKVLFLVPTVVLVEQQARVCRESSGGKLKVAEVCGEKTGKWTSVSWERCLQNSDVLVGTPAIFSKAFITNGFLSMSQFSLLIFDEVHNAVGTSPMGNIMHDAYWRAEPGSRPRVLGLTASIISGDLTNLEIKRGILESTMDASVFRPEVSVEYMRTPSFSKIGYDADQLKDYKEMAQAKVDLLFDLCEGMRIKEKDVKKIKQHALHVLEECGMAGFTFFISESLVYQLEGIANTLADIPGCEAKARNLSKSLPELRKVFRKAACDLHAYGQLARAPYISSKSTTLFEVLDELFERHRNTPQYKGIVFVQQCALTYPLAHLINHHFPHGTASALSGVGTMSSSYRSHVLDLFKKGQLKVLVCTAAVEEGLDVADCQFVIRYSRVSTAKSHIQGAGRARHAGAEIMYFENDPEQLEAEARKMVESAQDDSRNQSEESRATQCKAVEVPGFYPYRPSREGGGLVTIFNCVEIFQEYCAKALGQSINLESSTCDLCEYQQKIVCDVPREERKCLVYVHYPCPKGYVTVTLEDVSAHWKDIKVDSVAGTRKLKPKDVDKHRFIYTVIVQMHTKGHLTMYNLPNAIAETQAAVKGKKRPGELRLGDKFASDSLNSSGPSHHPSPTSFSTPQQVTPSATAGNGECGSVRMTMPSNSPLLSEPQSIENVRQFEAEGDASSALSTPSTLPTPTHESVSSYTTSPAVSVGMSPPSVLLTYDASSAPKEHDWGDSFPSHDGQGKTEHRRKCRDCGQLARVKKISNKKAVAEPLPGVSEFCEGLIEYEI